jgi:hypothetical protein
MDLNMAEDNIIVTHSGRESSVEVTGDPTRLEAFRSALIREGFKTVAEGEHQWELRRDIRPMAGDWPMKLRIEGDGRHWRISFFMFTPWSWIIVFSLMVLLFVPFASFQGAPLAFVLALGVVGLAIYKQKLDFSPDASWQGPPRREWHDRMRRLLDEAFGEVRS